jgi:DNA repair exonuclease SbcCD ATPase subunit
MSNRKTIYIQEENEEWVENAVDNLSGLVNRLLAEERKAMELSAEEQLQEQLNEVQEELEEQRETLEEKQEQKERLENKLEKLHEAQKEREEEVVQMVERLYDNNTNPNRWVQMFKSKGLVGDPRSLFDYIVEETELLHDTGDKVIPNALDEPEKEIEKVREWIQEQQGN